MKKTFFSVIFFILCSAAFSQNAADILSIITGKFQKYTDSFPREEVFVQTDRDIYISGEEIWFNVLLFDRKYSSLSDNSKIAYLEVLNTVNRPVVQMKVGLNNGSGAGKVVLPDTIRPGIYTLRAYTNWMKNFMPGNCFSKRLKVFSDQKDQVYFVPDNPQKRYARQDSAKDIVSVKIIKKQNIEACILTDNNFRSLNNSTCYLFVQTHGNINYRSAIILSGDTTKIEIPLSDLIPGVNQFTLFNASGKPVNEVYMLTRFEENEFVEVKIESPDSIKTRENLSISIQDINAHTDGDTANLIVTVVPAGTRSKSEIADYLLMGSEFGEWPESFSQNGLENIPDSLINEFLLTTRSSWIDWSLILSDHQPEIRYMRETKYHNLTGKLLDYKADSLDGRFVFMSIPGKIASFQYSRCEKEGLFSFSLPLDDKLRDLIIQGNNQDKKFKPIILSSFSDQYPPKYQKGNYETAISPLIRQMGVNQLTKRIYRSFDPPIQKTREKFAENTSRFHIKPDFELKMEDYIKLPTMQEVFFELIPGVSLSSERSGYKVTVIDKFVGLRYENPVLMIDGVIIQDPDIIAGVDPQLVEKIDIIRSRYIVGDYIFPGLVNLITTKTDLGNITLPDYTTRILYRAFEPEEKFISPEYSLPEKKSNHLPDLRNTLYWNVLPLRMSGIKQNIGFYTSDFLADYDIIVQGVTKKGLLISSKKSLMIIR